MYGGICQKYGIDTKKKKKKTLSSKFPLYILDSQFRVKSGYLEKEKNFNGNT